MTLNELPIGKTAVIRTVGGSGALRQHFLDMGIIPGAEITPVRRAPMGDPMAFRIHGGELSLRIDDARRIEIGRAHAAPPVSTPPPPAQRDIPGAGKDETPLPHGTPLAFALAGNPNCGKTTLFNQLTGLNQHVGNFPGVTVDRKDGVIRGHADARVTDLPGIYSLSPYTGEEVITRQFLLDEHPNGIINIVDATAIERSLYLSLQLAELGIPMVLALNMMDEVRQAGGSIRAGELEALLGIPVIPISAAKGEGIDALVDRALRAARLRERPRRIIFCGEGAEGDSVRRCLRDLAALAEYRARAADIPVRFAASKLAEGDALIPEQLHLSPHEREAAEHIIRRMEQTCSLDRAAALADMRYGFIRRACGATVNHPRKSGADARSERIDRVLAGRFTAIPALIGILGLVFYLTFHVVGSALSDLLERGTGLLAGAADAMLASAGVDGSLHSLVIDGVFAGVGSVLSFLPVIVTLFFFLSLLEDSGYMARVAFVMDRPLRRLGLSGRSIVPMLMGFGCTVPGVMSTRTLPSERDRRMTLLLTPFMSCSAKLPIYAFFGAVFFPDRIVEVMIGLYALGIAMGVVAAMIMRGTLFRGEAAPFVMELPRYRMPGLKSVARLLWEKAKDFLERAFTIILIATIVIWFLQTFDAHMRMVSDSQDSLLAALAGGITPLFAPLGFGDWRICTALITGFMAKESVVSTLTLLFASPAALHAALSPLSAACLLVFCLLYTPCVAAVSSIRRELGGRWALAVVLAQCAVAWFAALAVRLAGLALGAV